MSLVVSPCLGCGKSDDHPKHQAVTGGEHTSVHWHMDCHALADPPCALCAWHVAHKGSLTGAEWRGHILAFHAELEPHELDQEPHERRVVESHRDGKVTV